MPRYTVRGRQSSRESTGQELATRESSSQASISRASLRREPSHEGEYDDTRDYTQILNPIIYEEPEQISQAPLQISGETARYESDFEDGDGEVYDTRFFPDMVPWDRSYKRIAIRFLYRKNNGGLGKAATHAMNTTVAECRTVRLIRSRLEVEPTLMKMMADIKADFDKNTRCKLHVYVRDELKYQYDLTNYFMYNTNYSTWVGVKNDLPLGKREPDTWTHNGIIAEIVIILPREHMTDRLDLTDFIAEMSARRQEVSDFINHPREPVTGRQPVPGTEEQEPAPRSTSRDSQGRGSSTRRRSRRDPPQYHQ